jgi:hypothetical protein
VNLVDTPIAAVLRTEQARRHLSSMLRLMGHAERCRQELGADDAANLVAEVNEALLHDVTARQTAA